MYPRDLMDQAIATTSVVSVKERYKTTEVARQSFKSATIVKPPAVPGVEQSIDMHCHAHGRLQDALSLAKHASVNGMAGIVFKSISPTPAKSVKQVDDDVRRWCDDEKLAPARVWSAHIVGRGGVPISSKAVKTALDDGASVVWMPVPSHANTMSTVATIRADPDDPTGPPKLQKCVSWEEAKKLGHYALDEHGRLLPEMRDIIHLVHDRGAVLSLGHARREEQMAMVEEIQKIGFKKCFIDHPFSPYIRLSIDEMKQFVGAGIYLNFTYNELSPLLGIDPFTMMQAAKEVGIDHVLLSSDAGDPFFPNSVECIRLMRVYAEAFGLTPEEVYQATALNPAKLLADVRQ